MVMFGNTVALALLSLVLADDPSPYVPTNVTCPYNASFTRDADSLSRSEARWIKSRDQVTRPILIDWLNHSNMSDFDASSFLSNQTIKIGLAYSGGGYRAMLAGAGQLAALDNRTAGSNQTGHLGGLLQATTYLAGLSGGNWLVGSVVMNNFSSVEALQHDKNLWNLDHSLIDPGGFNLFSDADYWDTIVTDAQDKQDAGFNISLTDLWGRGLGYQLFNASEGGQNLSYVAIRDYDVFKSHEMPFPIHVTDQRQIGETIIDTNSTNFEFNPFELGSWDPSVHSFTDLKYIGSKVSNGDPDSNQCVVGYDNAGYMVGTSATLFNQFILQLNSTGIGGWAYDIIEDILKDLGNDGDDVALYSNNPFQDVSYVTQNDEELLTLVDGGEDGQNIPLQPLIQPERGVDVILAFDNSADTSDSWPNGASLISSYERQFGDQSNNTIFPHVPDNNTFVYGGLTEQPTFFGCNRTNLTSLFSDSLPESERYYPPLVVYIANSYHSYGSNQGTFKLSYDEDELGGMIENGYETTTQNNGTIDSEWRACLGCAIILREQQRRGEEPTSQCQKCFDHYCWDGSTVSDTSNGPSRRDGKNNTVSNQAHSTAVAAEKTLRSSDAAVPGAKAGALSTIIVGLLSYLL